MSSRGRHGAAPAASVPPVAAALAGALGASLGVLGWLVTQAATFGVAEHTHLTAHGLTSHRHDYAAPLAAGAGVVAVLAVLMLVVIHLGSSPHRTSSGPVASRRSFVRLAPAMAALLFVAVETVELAGSGVPVAVVSGILTVGAAMQWLAARAAGALTAALLRLIEGVTALPPRRSWSPASTRSVADTLVDSVVVRPRARVCDGRAPPTRLLALVPVPDR
jgi:hypothetical protein